MPPNIHSNKLKDPNKIYPAFILFQFLLQKCEVEKGSKQFRARARSRSGTSSLLPDCSSTPKTSKQKKTLKSKKDVAHRRSASPAY